MHCNFPFYLFSDRIHIEVLGVKSSLNSQMVANLKEHWVELLHTHMHSRHIQYMHVNCLCDLTHIGEKEKSWHDKKGKVYIENQAFRSKRQKSITYTQHGTKKNHYKHIRVTTRKAPNTRILQYDKWPHYIHTVHQSKVCLQ